LKKERRIWVFSNFSNFFSIIFFLSFACFHDHLTTVIFDLPTKGNKGIMDKTQGRINAFGASWWLFLSLSLYCGQGKTRTKNGVRRRKKILKRKKVKKERKEKGRWLARAGVAW